MTPAAGVTLTGGEAAGEPLHFEPGGENTLRALVGVPVEVGDSFGVTLFCADPIGATPQWRIYRCAGAAIPVRC